MDRTPSRGDLDKFNSREIRNELIEGKEDGKRKKRKKERKNEGDRRKDDALYQFALELCL